MNNMKRKYQPGGDVIGKGRKPYKYGGHNVPGMFQGGGDIGAAPKKRNIFGRIGAGIGNVFRSDANDRSIKYQGYKNPQVGSGPTPERIQRFGSQGVGQVGIGIPGSTDFGNTTNNQKQGFYNSNAGNFRPPGRQQKGMTFSRGGSIGPNGTL